MGRSSGGGAAGGGSGGGGFSGGGRSSGGFSGGNRSGGRSSAPRSHSSSSRNFGPGYGPMGGFGGSPWGYPRRRYGGGSFMGGFFGSLLGNSMSRSQRSSGTGSGTHGDSAASSSSVPPTSTTSPQSSGGFGCGTLFIVLCVILLAWMLFSAFGCTGSSDTGGSGAYEGVTSTHQREKLPAGTAQITPYYNDLDGDWIHNTNVLETGLRAFADETGVMPYVYILPNGATSSTAQLTQTAQEVYDENFDDEGHFVLVFCDNGQGGFNCGYCTGSAARSVMDDEAVSILAKNLDAAYANQNLSEEEIFSQAFSKTAQEIMADPTEVQREAQRPLIVGVVVLAVGAAVVVIFVVRKNRAAKRQAEQQRLDDLLNQPLETFKDQELEDLEKKYSDK